MATLATLFLPATGLPVAEHLAQAAASARIVAERGGLLRRVRSWRLELPGLEVRVRQLDEADRQVRIRESCRWIEESGGDGLLQRRLVDAPTVVEIEAVPEASGTSDPRVWTFARDLRAGLGARLLARERLEDRSGQVEVDGNGPRDRGTRAPTLRRVLHRLLLTQALVARGHLERASFAGREDEPARILAWLERQGAGGEAGAAEREEILRGPGLLDNAQVLALTWRAEFLAVLAWSLGACRLPAHDRLANPYELLGGLGFLEEVLHPRLLVPEPKGERACAELAAELRRHHERLEAGDPEQTLRGMPRARAEPGLVDLARHIAAQRRAAIEWVLGA